MQKFLFLATLFFSATVFADPKEFLFLKKQQEAFTIQSDTAAVLTDAMNQKIDHNSPKDNRTFPQRFWYNSQYANGFGGPVILYICGEGECGSYAVTGTMARHARQLKAHIVALEHRYYGQSHPFTDLKTENLKYLTIDQALKDLVSFKKHIQENFKLTGPWVAVGGSYAGAMAAYLRTQYPEEFIGALASSGPVQADNDFSEYDLHVAKMAGAKCLAAVQSAVSELETMIETEKGFEAAKAMFDADVLRGREDFLYLIADTAAAAVQYGLRDAFCELVTVKGLEGYVDATRMVKEIFGNLVDMSAQAAENTSLESAGGSIGMRQWFYQSCTEFGFWQNAYHDESLRARSSKINHLYHKAICKRLFGLNELGDVAKTNEIFYNPILENQKPNILFTNGNQDPWINLSITDQKLNPNLVTFVIQNGAHCDDLTDSMNPTVIEAQGLFTQLAFNWIKQLSLR